MNSETNSIFECSKCKQTFNVTERDNHELICLYTLQAQPDQITTIPCETCGKSIPFSSFPMHMNMCGMDQTFINDILSNVNMSNMDYDRYSNRFTQPSYSNNEDNESNNYESNNYKPNYESNNYKPNYENTPEDEPMILPNDVPKRTDSMPSLYEEDEPIIEPSQIDMVDDSDLRENMQMLSQNIERYFQEHDGMPYYENTPEPPLDDNMEVDEEPNNTTITSEPVGYDVAYEGSIGNFGSEQPEGTTLNERKTTTTSNPEVNTSTPEVNTSNVEVKPEDWEFPIPSFKSPPQIHVAIPSHQNDEMDEDDEYPRLPPMSGDHQAQFNKLKHNIGYSLNNHLFGRPKPSRRNAFNFVRRGYNSGMRPNISEQMRSTLPPELKHLLDISNLGQRQTYESRIQNRRSRNSESETYEELKEMTERVGVVEIGVSNLDAVAPFYQITDDKIYNCAVCADKQSKQSKCRKMICDHPDIFCDNCVTKWLSKSKKCPICMKDLEDIYNEMVGQIIEEPQPLLEKIPTKSEPSYRTKSKKKGKKRNNIHPKKVETQSDEAPKMKNHKDKPDMNDMKYQMYKTHGYMKITSL